MVGHSSVLTRLQEYAPLPSCGSVSTRIRNQGFPAMLVLGWRCIDIASKEAKVRSRWLREIGRVMRNAITTTKPDAPGNARNLLELPPAAPISGGLFSVTFQMIRSLPDVF